MAETKLSEDAGLGNTLDRAGVATRGGSRAQEMQALRERLSAPDPEQERTAAAARLEQLEAEVRKEEKARLEARGELPGLVAKYRSLIAGGGELETELRAAVAPILDRAREAAAEATRTRAEIETAVRRAAPGCTALRSTHGGSREVEEAFEALCEALGEDGAIVRRIVFDPMGVPSRPAGLVGALLDGTAKPLGMTQGMVDAIARDTKGPELPAGPTTSESMTAVRGAILGR